MNKHQDWRQHLHFHQPCDAQHVPVLAVVQLRERGSVDVGVEANRDGPRAVDVHRRDISRDYRDYMEKEW